MCKTFIKGGNKIEKKEKLTQSQIDGVAYRRAKLWQIILVASSGMVGMGFYCLIGLASYSASIGLGSRQLPWEGF